MRLDEFQSMLCPTGGMDEPVEEWVMTYQPKMMCFSTPNNGGSCVQNCVNAYNEQFQGCVSEYCTEI